MSGLVGNPEDRFSCGAAHFSSAVIRIFHSRPSFNGILLSLPSFNELFCGALLLS